MDNTDDLDELILETLSFFEPMTFEKIILDFDPVKLRLFPHFNREVLNERLTYLKKKKKIKIIKGKESCYIKKVPKRPWWKQIF